MPRLRFTAILRKTFEIDTDKDWGGDLNGVKDALETCGYDTVEGLSTFTKDQIHEALNQMLNDDLSSVVDLDDICELDFTIEVTQWEA